MWQGVGGEVGQTLRTVQSIVQPFCSPPPLTHWEIDENKVSYEGSFPSHVPIFLFLFFLLSILHCLLCNINSTSIIITGITTTVPFSTLNWSTNPSSTHTTAKDYHTHLLGESQHTDVYQCINLNSK